MKNKTLKTLFLIIASIFSLNTFAETWHATYIKTIYPLSDGNFIIIPETDSANCSGTSGNQYFWVKVDFNGMTEKGLEKIYVSAVAAHISKKRVHINFDETDSYCSVNRIQVFDY